MFYLIILFSDSERETETKVSKSGDVSVEICWLAQ